MRGFVLMALVTTVLGLKFPDVRDGMTGVSCENVVLWVRLDREAGEEKQVVISETWGWHQHNEAWERIEERAWAVGEQPSMRLSKGSFGWKAIVVRARLESTKGWKPSVSLHLDTSRKWEGSGDGWDTGVFLLLAPSAAFSEPSLHPPGSWAVHSPGSSTAFVWGFGGNTVGGLPTSCRSTSEFSEGRAPWLPPVEPFWSARSSALRPVGALLLESGQMLAQALTGADARCGSLDVRFSSSKLVPFIADESGAGAWVPCGRTMVGTVRLGTLQSVLEAVAREGVEGDVLETGVWRGGSMLFARRQLDLLREVGWDGASDRRVWLLDSFQGLPPPVWEADGLDMSNYSFLSAPMEEVVESFHRYGVLREQTQVVAETDRVSLVQGPGVAFLKGFFDDSIPFLVAHPAAPQKIAVLRLDGDMFSSTLQALFHLAPRVPAGGWIIVDDWMLHDARSATLQFRNRTGHHDPIIFLQDKQSIMWRVQHPIRITEQVKQWYYKLNAERKSK